MQNAINKKPINPFFIVFYFDYIPVSYFYYFSVIQAVASVYSVAEIHCLPLFALLKSNCKDTLFF